MHLAFRGARANRAPGDQIGNILRRNHIQIFHRHRHAAIVQIEQQLARHAQAVVNIKAAVEIGIIKQPLPAHRGARLFKIDAHHDFQTILITRAQGQQTLGIFMRRFNIVNRTGANYHQQTAIFAGKHLMNGIAAALRGGGGVGGNRILLQQRHRRQQLADILDAQIVGLIHTSFPKTKTSALW